MQQGTKQRIGGTDALDVYVEDGMVILYQDSHITGWNPSHATKRGYRFDDVQQARTLAEALVAAANRVTEESQ